MIEAPSELPLQRNPALVRVVATATYLAAIIALWGFTSLLRGRVVMIHSDVGPLLFSAMALAACVATWLSLARSGRMARWVRALASAVLALAGMLLCVAAWYVLTSGNDWSWFLLVLFVFAVNLFVIAAALLSGVTVLLAAAFTRREEKKRLSTST